MSEPCRQALIRLLWRSVADGDACDDREECNTDPLDICEAVRALGIGKHWDMARFQRWAMKQEKTNG